MNKRIRELAEQAGLIAGKHDDLDFKKELTSKEKKFAELIVKQCAAMAKGFEFAVGRDGLSNAMREHFGVEE